MSTFLLCLGVITATIAVVVRVALNGPDQPATIRQQPPRARPRRRTTQSPAEGRAWGRRGGRSSGPPSTAPVAMPGNPVGPITIPGTPGFALPDSETMRHALPAAPTTVGVRIRSGVALVVLVAVLGALLALAVAALLIGAVVLIRSATG